jgi:hypothetical protein
MTKAIGTRSAEDERKTQAHKARVQAHRGAKLKGKAANGNLGLEKPKMKLDRSAAAKQAWANHREKIIAGIKRALAEKKKAAAVKP